MLDANWIILSHGFGASNRCQDITLGQLSCDRGGGAVHQVSLSINIAGLFIFLLTNFTEICDGVVADGKTVKSLSENRKITSSLRLSRDNPRYFTDDSGKAIYLTGSHTWSNLIDIDKTDSPNPFDFEGYLDFLGQHNHNFIRLWTWELAKYQYQGDEIKYAEPFPWRRTGPGNALDGKPKFDLTKFNKEYFNRLRKRVIDAGERGIYTSIMLFEGHGLRNSLPPWCWDGHPFNINNNINDINGDPNSDGKGIEVHTLQIPAVLAIQKEYVKKVIDTVNDLDNVLYEIANESHEGSGRWQEELIQYIHTYESLKPKQHPVVYSAPDSSRYARRTINALLNTRAEAVSPGWEDAPADNSIVPYRDDPPANDGKKVIINDTDHLWGVGGDRSWVWKSFVRGLNPIYMDDLTAGVTHDEVRKALGQTLSYARKMNLKDMRPSNDLSSTKYCLANPGKEYFIYKPYSFASFKVNLKAGNHSFEWFNPGKSINESSGSFTAIGGYRSFIPPFAGDAVLYIVRS